MSSCVKATAGGWAETAPEEPRRASHCVRVKGAPFGEEFGVLGGVPSGAVAHVGEPEYGMKAAVAEDVEGCLQSCVVWEERMLV